MLSDCEPMESGRLMSSAEGSHVLTYPLPDEGKELMPQEAAFGLNSLELLAKYNPDTQSWRMSQTSWLETQGDGSVEFLETWPRSGMMRSGIAYRLPDLVPHTDGIGSGLLPTPSSREGADWSRPKILASLDRGGCVARRICALSMTALSHEEPVGLNPSFGEWMMGYKEGWTDFEESATPSSHK